MTTSYQDIFARPEFDALVIQFEPAASGNLKAQAAAMLEAAVGEILGTPAAGWDISPVPGMPAYFDLIPPPGHLITVKQAFDLKNVLKKERALQYVEALFETNLDNLPEESGEREETIGASDLSTPLDRLTAIELNSLWNHEIVQTEAAWEHSRGEGILIGHPDSGYIPHFELDNDRLRHDLERNFYDSAIGASNVAERGGNHGLGTATVLMSGSGQQNGTHPVVGIAPAATLVPMRITRKGPPVFLSRSGPRRVRDAICYAIRCGCHVISLSLGGPFEKSLHEAIQEAVRQNIIVCAAAGNVVGFVVWPARYPEVIAVAACTAERKKWIFSCRGRAVDVTAPGHNVWRAYIDESGRESSAPGSGTSYATPHVAGIAALWLAKHCRDKLLQMYSGVPLYQVFRHVLMAACDPFLDDELGEFGAGIVNAARTVSAPLPDRNQLSDSSLEALGEVAPEEAITQTDYFSAIFDVLPKAEVRRRLAALLDVPEADLEAHLQMANKEELAFHLLTNPDLREYLTGVGVVDTEGLLDIGVMSGVEIKGQALHHALMNSPLSDELRIQLSAGDRN
jgi:thermitase